METVRSKFPAQSFGQDGRAVLPTQGSALPSRPNKVVPVLGVLAALAGATTISSGTLPWEGPLWAIVNSVSGPIAIGVGFIALVICGLMLLFGRSEMDDFIKKLLTVVCILALLLGAWGIMQTLFPKAGLQKTDPEQGHVLPSGQYIPFESAGNAGE